VKVRPTDQYRSILEEWRQRRYADLKGDLGWLTLSGLGWLREGRNTVGSDPDCDVVLPSGPPAAGTVEVWEGRIIASGAFELGGAPVGHVELVADVAGEATLLELGPLRICVIERGGRLAIRTWDTEAKQRREFRGIDHWPTDPAWRLDGRFEPTPLATIGVPDVLGTVDEQPSPGAVSFEIGGVRHRLEALSGGPGGDLWLVFGDETNGDETYGGGRFVYTGVPEADGSVTVDFNRAYNPPCVFSPYATCPLPWPANRLPLRIEAGERMHGDDRRH
jgi:hypothetical protein